MKKNWTAANYPSKKVVVVQTVTFEGDEDAVTFLINNNNSFRSSGVTRVLVTRDVTDDNGEVHHTSNEVNVGCVTSLPRYSNE